MVNYTKTISPLVHYTTLKKLSTSRRLAMLLCLLTTSSAGYLSTSANASVDKNTSFTSKRMREARENRELDPSLKKAVEIAETEAEPRSTNWCWRYVKTALLRSGAVDRYPGTANAKQAGGELKHFGFEQIDVDDPYEAPVGAVLVYGGPGPGHVELKTEDGFVSDFKTAKASKRPLTGVWVKFEEDAGPDPEEIMQLALLEEELASATPKAQMPRD